MLKEVDELKGQGDERFVDILLPTSIIISFLLSPSHLLLFSDFPIPNSDFRFLSSDIWLRVAVRDAQTGARARHKAHGVSARDRIE
jgi:hypothetical protein